ncbi:MAG: hypothetical protein LN412_04860 [Candidatus Thermoplasmatota archaeon]|nr:hypothetical protein [Candidatus Thermoplasmatota archaeon]
MLRHVGESFTDVVNRILGESSVLDLAGIGDRGLVTSRPEALHILADCIAKGAIRPLAMIEATLRVHLPCSWVTLVTTKHGAIIDIVQQKDFDTFYCRGGSRSNPGMRTPVPWWKSSRETAVSSMRVERIIVELATSRVKNRTRPLITLSEAPTFLGRT